MKTTILILVVLIHFTQSFSQEKQVDIIAVRNEKDLVFNAINYTDLRQEITLKITATNLIGYKKPITKFVAAKDTVPMTNLFLSMEKDGDIQPIIQMFQGPRKQKLPCKMNG